MKMSTGKLFAAAAITFSIGAGNAAFAAVWEGDVSSDYFDLNNWSGPPANFTSGDFDILTNGGQPVPVINSAGPAAGMRGFWVGKYHTGAVGTGQLDVIAGANANFDGTTSRVGLGNGGTGTYNQSGGTITLHTLQVGLDAGSNGTVNLTGGNLIIGKAFGGDLESVEIGKNGTGSVNISGGAFTTRSGVTVGDGGNGTFTVIGSDATQIGIGSEGSIDGAWVQTATGTLAAQVDAGGITKIFIDDTGHAGTNDGNVSFAAGSLLDLSFEGAPVSGTWTLMEWEGTLTDNGLALAPSVDTNIWSFNLDATNKVLTITAVPEPASLALMGLGGLMLIGRRRKA